MVLHVHFLVCIIIRVEAWADRPSNADFQFGLYKTVLRLVKGMVIVGGSIAVRLP